MFRCQKCSTVVPTSVRATKVVISSRPRVYEPRGQDPRERRGRVSRFQRGRKVKKRKPYDKGGQGSEIVRELAVCPRCAAEFAVEAEAARLAEANRIPETVEFAEAVEPAETITVDE